MAVRPESMSKRDHCRPRPHRHTEALRSDALEQSAQAPLRPEERPMDLLTDFNAADPVSEVLRAVRIRSTVYCRSVMGAPWGFGVMAHGNPAFHVVTAGGCWLE